MSEKNVHELKENEPIFIEIDKNDDMVNDDYDHSCSMKELIEIEIKGEKKKICRKFADQISKDEENA